MTTKDKTVGWHDQVNGHEFGQSPGDGEGQGDLACCGSRGHKELGTTELLNNTTNDISGNINFNHLAKIVFPSVFTVKLLFFPFDILF